MASGRQLGRVALSVGLARPALAGCGRPPSAEFERSRAPMNSSVICWGDNQLEQLELPEALAPP